MAYVPHSVHAQKAILRKRSAKRPAVKSSRLFAAANTIVVDKRKNYVSGQSLAGTGALVFEGEILDTPRHN